MAEGLLMFCFRLRKKTKPIRNNKVEFKKLVGGDMQTGRSRALSRGVYFQPQP